jgi:hypothetical protein
MTCCLQFIRGVRNDLAEGMHKIPIFDKQEVVSD